jgi:hypothetical protein
MPSHFNHIYSLTYDGHSCLLPPALFFSCFCIENRILLYKAELLRLTRGDLLKAHNITKEVIILLNQKVASFECFLELRQHNLIVTNASFSGNWE